MNRRSVSFQGPPCRGIPPETPGLVNAAYDYIRIPYGIFAAEPFGASALVNPFTAHVIDRDGLVYQDDQIRVTAMKAVGDLATIAQVKTPTLSHFVGGEDGARFAAMLRQYYPGPVFAREDLARYCLAADGSKSRALTPCK